MNAIATVILEDLPVSVSEHLPDEVLTKLAHLRSLRDDSRDLYQAAEAAYMRLREPGSDLVWAEQELRQLTDAPIGVIMDNEFRRGKVTPEQQAETSDRHTKRQDALVQTVAALRVQHNQARELRDQRGKVSLHHVGLYERVVQWLKENARSSLTLADPIDLSGTGNLTDELGTVRTLIGALLAEERRLQGVSIPLADVEQRIAAYVDAMAAKVSFGGLINRDDRPRPLLPEVHPEVALLCWLQPKEMVRRLLTEAKSLTDFKHGLNDLEWEEQRASLAARLFDAELREEALVCALALQGNQVIRRANASPPAILQLAANNRRRRAKHPN